MRILAASILAAVCAAVAPGMSAAGFDRHFCDSTLRLDYIFGGIVSADGTPHCTVLYDGAVRTPGWAGRRHHLDSVPLAGNGTITLLDPVKGDTLYMTSFSTLFQEWLSTSEAVECQRAFENSFLVPVPRSDVRVSVDLRDSHGKLLGGIDHLLRPSDILIADRSNAPAAPHRWLHRGGDSDKVIDIAILAEGYTADEADKFYADAQTAVEAILSHEPFASRASDFNFVAVAAPSADSGVSVPGSGEWRSTAVNSNFNTFYSDRYLTTGHVRQIHECLTNIPYEHIIILANTPVYGGGGIYNFYTLTTAGHKNFRPVVVHEFGHSFGGLADEYFYADDPLAPGMYHSDFEPWEQNLTTLADFSSKWEDMLAEGTPRPTAPEDASRYPVGLYEGGGYQTLGVFRPADDCRMRTNTCAAFCPVCQRAISRVIDFYVR